MSREYVYFLSHPPIGSLCSIDPLCSLGFLGSLPLHFASGIYGLIQKVKSPQKKRSCSPSQHRTLTPNTCYFIEGSLRTLPKAKTHRKMLFNDKIKSINSKFLLKAFHQCSTNRYESNTPKSEEMSTSKTQISGQR